MMRLRSQVLVPVQVQRCPSAGVIDGMAVVWDQSERLGIQRVVGGNAVPCGLNFFTQCTLTEVAGNGAAFSAEERALAQVAIREMEG